MKFMKAHGPMAWHTKKGRIDCKRSTEVSLAFLHLEKDLGEKLGRLAVSIFNSKGRRRRRKRDDDAHKLLTRGMGLRKHSVLVARASATPGRRRIQAKNV